MNTLFSHLSPDKILTDEGFIVGEQKGTYYSRRYLIFKKPSTQEIV